MAVKQIYSIFGCALLIVGVNACTSIQTGGNVARGRQALFGGNNSAALGYFQAAQQLDPAYVYGAEFRTGVLSYLGRAQYLTGNYAQARSTLETAVSQNSADNIAQLYLGLTLARQGENEKALRVIDEAMRGIHETIDYIADNFKFTYGQYWDPGRAIRSAIEKDRGLIATAKVDWPTLIADGEWIALQAEREPDMAVLQERSQRSLNLD